MPRVFEKPNTKTSSFKQWGGDTLDETDATIRWCVAMLGSALRWLLFILDEFNNTTVMTESVRRNPQSNIRAGETDNYFRRVDCRSDIATLTISALWKFQIFYITRYILLTSSHISMPSCLNHKIILHCNFIVNKLTTLSHFLHLLN